MRYLIPVLVLLLLVSCKSEEKKSTTAPTKTVPLNERPIPPNPNANGGVVGLNVIGGAHYMCPQKHTEGNSAVAGTCPKCSIALVHNQGFHNAAQTSPTNTTSPVNQNTPATNNGPNANGEYHYTCSNGCAGGAGAAGNCSTCGNTLAHNQAYHS